MNASNCSCNAVVPMWNRSIPRRQKVESQSLKKISKWHSPSFLFHFYFPPFFSFIYSFHISLHVLRCHKNRNWIFKKSHRVALNPSPQIERLGLPLFPPTRVMVWWWFGGGRISRTIDEMTSAISNLLLPQSYEMQIVARMKISPSQHPKILLIPFSFWI